jgi:spermidine synthase
MTALTPITKFMVHLPLSFHEGADPSVLVICFGMGTSYRSALSWDVDTTVVELVPSVPKEFGYYHSDAAEVLKNPKGHIVIDDGRRFLKRTPLKFDVIATDPPPPLQAAGSSLLYSPEFFELVKQHLKPKGIVQIWLPGGDLMSDLAVVRSVYSSFPYVRSFPSIVANGVHMLCSMEPVEQHTAEELLARMPAGAPPSTLARWCLMKCRRRSCSIQTRESGSPMTNRTTNISCCATGECPWNITSGPDARDYSSRVK